MKLYQVYILLFFKVALAQQVPIDSISYQYFYGDELKQIVALKKNQEGKPFNAKAQIQIAEIYDRINCEDSAYVTFYKVYENEKLNKSLSDEEYKQLLLDLHQVEYSKHNYEKDRHFFLKELKRLAQNETSDKWKTLVNKEIANVYFTDSLDNKTGYRKMYALKDSDYFNTNDEFKSVVLLNLGNISTAMNKFEQADDFLKQSLQVAKFDQNLLYQVYANINLAVNELKQKNFQEALIYLNEAEQVPNEKFLIKINRIVHKLKKRIYEGINEPKLIHHHHAYIKRYDSIISDFRKNSNFYEIDVAYQTREKDKRIQELSKLKSVFSKNRIVFSILLFLVFLLALYSFIRWKKVDRKKRLLAQKNKELSKENEATKNELETVKSLVVNDYIILKNKSKVYLKELIYIKSDGHYLNLHTTSKKEFVRGKISEIEKQLPPNFIKCQRSYIVNENFIKQYSSTEVFMTNGDVIPLSRGFKF